MIIAVHTEVGERSHEYLKRLLAGKFTLVVAPKPRIAFLGHEWRGYNVTYVSPYKAFPEGHWDQVYVDCIRLTTVQGRPYKMSNDLIVRLREFSIILFRPVVPHDVTYLMRML